MKVFIFILIIICEVQAIADTKEEELFEGDIAGVRFYTNRIGKRNVLRNQHSLWPQATIPYVVSGYFNWEQKKMIQDAISEIEKLSCVRFRAKTTNDRDYVDIVSGDSCFAYVGRSGGRQTVELGYYCFDHIGTVIHELMHTLGFWHEQNRWDRDEYVDIMWNNIRDDAKCNFDKYNWNLIRHFGEPYDVDSIMHYFHNQMAKNWYYPTIVSKKDPLKLIKVKTSLSEIDIRKLNKLYRCQEQEAAQA